MVSRHRESGISVFQNVLVLNEWPVCLNLLNVEQELPLQEDGETVCRGRVAAIPAQS